MNKPLQICLLVVVLGHASFSQDGVAPKDDMAKRRQAYEEAEAKAYKEAHLPIVEDNNFSIALSSKKTTFYGGEPIQVEITLKNNGQGKVTVAPTLVETFFDIDMIGPYGGIESLPSRYMRATPFVSVRSYDFLPGKKICGIVFVSNLFDMALNGTYKIKVSKQFRLKDAKGEIVTITSNTLLLKVTSDSPVSQWSEGGGV